MGGMVSEKHPYWFTQSCPQFHVHDHLKSTWQSCRLLLWRNRTQEYDKSIRRTWKIHLTESVPNWRKRLGRWFLFEFWMRLLFLIRNTEFMCCRIQICAQHGSHNENFPWKMAPKFNWALSGGSFSRLTFWVRRRTCLYPILTQYTASSSRNAQLSQLDLVYSYNPSQMNCL